MLNFNEFYTQKFKEITARGLSSGLSEADSKDLAQNVLLDFWKRLRAGTVDENKNIDGFLSVRTRWRTVDFIRRNQTAAENFSIIGEENDLDTLPAERKERPKNHRRLLKRAIQEINPKKSKWFKLFYESVFNEKPVEQICAEYNVKPSTVHVEKCRQGKKLIAAAQALLKNGF